MREAGTRERQRDRERRRRRRIWLGESRKAGLMVTEGGREWHVRLLNQIREITRDARGKKRIDGYIGIQIEMVKEGDTII